MVFVSRFTGQIITYEQHLAQSVADILTTRVGTRVAVRDYGSYLPDIIDRPVNRQWFSDAYLCTADALARWEPRTVFSRVVFDLTNLADNIVGIGMDGYSKDLKKAIQLRNLTLDFNADQTAFLQSLQVNLNG